MILQVLPIYRSDQELFRVCHAGHTLTVQEIVQRMSPFNGHLSAAFQSFDRVLGPTWQARASAYIYAVMGYGIAGQPELRILYITKAEIDGMVARGGGFGQNPLDANAMQELESQGARFLPGEMAVSFREAIETFQLDRRIFRCLEWQPGPIVLKVGTRLLAQLVMSWVKLPNLICCEYLPSLKTNMTMENQPFEDVSPLKN